MRPKFLKCLLLTVLAAGTTIGAENEPPDTAMPAPNDISLPFADLLIWNDPAFRKRFIESYIAETEVEPRVTIDEREQMQKVLAFISEDRMEKALALLEKLRGEAASAVYDFTVGNIHFQNEALPEALAAYKLAVKKHPKFLRAWRNMALIEVRQGNYGEALTSFRKVIQLGGADALTYGLLGYSYSLKEQHLPAETAYRMAILLDPHTLDWHMGLARSLFKQERFPDAAALCGQLLADNPNRADLWLLQANAYIGMKQPLRAVGNYEVVDKLGQSTAASLNMMGDIYVNEELYDMAVDAYLRSMRKKRPESPSRALRAARVLVARGAFEETQNLLAGTEELYGDQMDEDSHKDLLKLQARLAVAAGADGEEVKILEKIVALDPMDGEALILLGQHSGRTGDIEKAIFYFERAAGLENFEADAKVRHAQLLVQQGKYADAIPLLRQAQDMKPRDHVQKYLDQVERVSKGR